MNRQWWLIVGLVTIFLLPPVYGQSQQVVSVDIPFDFVVNDTTMSAGHYTIRIDQRQEIISLSDGKQEVYFLFFRQSANAGEYTSPRTELVFSKQGEQRVLHQVYVLKDTHIHDLIHPAIISEP